MDRPVVGKTPLKFRTSGLVNSKDSLVVIGHPSGLPQKVAPGANIFRNNSTQSYFVTNLDTFGGNSGSAVFNERTGTIEGILVRGAKDYVKNEETGCVMVNREAEDITGNNTLGESVSRITDIPSLKYRTKFLKAAHLGKISEVKELLAQGVDINITDNDNNTALHLAAGAKQIDTVRFLVGQEGIDLEAVNLAGKTAKQMRTKGNKKVIKAINIAIANKK